MPDVVEKTTISGNAQPNMRNEELFDAILQAYKEAITECVKTSLGKSIWTNRELDWFYRKFTTMTINTQNLLDTIANMEDINNECNQQLVTDKGDKVSEAGTRAEADPRN